MGQWGEDRHERNSSLTPDKGEAASPHRSSPYRRAVCLSAQSKALTTSQQTQSAFYQRPPEWQILEKTPSGLKNHLVQPPSSTQISMTSPANDLPAFACRRPMRRLFMTAHCIFAEVFLVPQIGYTKPSTHPDLPLGLLRGRQIPFQYQSHSIIVPSLL